MKQNTYIIDEDAMAAALTELRRVLELEASGQLARDYSWQDQLPELPDLSDCPEWPEGDEGGVVQAEFYKDK